MIRTKRVLRDYIVQPCDFTDEYKSPNNRKGFLKVTYMVAGFGAEARLPKCHWPHQYTRCLFLYMYKDHEYDSPVVNGVPWMALKCLYSSAVFWRVRRKMTGLLEKLSYLEGLGNTTGVDHIKSGNPKPRWVLEPLLRIRSMKKIDSKAY